MKLQRNALSVLEPPTGNEEDEDYDFDKSGSEPEICEKDSGLCKLKHLILEENFKFRFWESMPQ